MKQAVFSFLVFVCGLIESQANPHCLVRPRLNSMSFFSGYEYNSNSNLVLGIAKEHYYSRGQKLYYNIGFQALLNNKIFLYDARINVFNFILTQDFQHMKFLTPGVDVVFCDFKSKAIISTGIDFKIVELSSVKTTYPYINIYYRYGLSKSEFFGRHRTGITIGLALNLRGNKVSKGNRNEPLNF